MDDKFNIGQEPPRDGKGKKTVPELVGFAEAAVANPGEWVSVTILGDTRNAKIAVTRHIVRVVADIRLRGAVIYLRYHGGDG